MSTNSTLPRTTLPRSTDKPTADEAPTRRRAPWRQRLVDVERGFTSGLRGDGAFFVHFFSMSIVLAAAGVLGISLLEWTAVILSLTLVLSAEMFRQVLKSLLEKVRHYFDDSATTALHMASAAVSVTITGAVLVIGLILTRAILAMFSTT